MLFSQARNHKVMSTDTASSVGMVGTFVIDPATAKVVALHLKKTSGEADTLHWEDLSAFGPDAVTVATAGAVVPARGRAADLLSGKGVDVLGRRVLTDGGTELGKVDDVEFDPETGTVLGLLTVAERIAGSRLRASGSYAVIVAES